MKFDQTEIDSFVGDLSTVCTDSDFSLNMYAGSSVYAKDRCHNLLYYLKFMAKLQPRILFVGEAPGRWGCLQTGIPFTDEFSLIYRDKIFGDLNCLIKNSILDGQKKHPLRESTSSVIWDCLDKLPMKRLPLLWNIYPFHPSTVSSDYLLPTERPNRTPNKNECELGMNILKRLIEIFDIEKIFAIGRTSESQLKDFYPEIKYLRHPARGGKEAFERLFFEIFNPNK